MSFGWPKKHRGTRTPFLQKITMSPVTRLTAAFTNFHTPVITQTRSTLLATNCIFCRKTPCCLLSTGTRKRLFFPRLESALARKWVLDGEMRVTVVARSGQSREEVVLSVSRERKHFGSQRRDQNCMSFTGAFAGPREFCHSDQ